MAGQVIIADDHPVVRRGLRVLLERAGYHIVGEAGTGREAVRLAELLHPDMAILDLSMPELDGLEAGKEIRQTSPDTKVLLFSVYEDPYFIRQAEEAGFGGYVLKCRAVDELLRAMQNILEGGAFFAPRGKKKRSGRVPPPKDAAYRA